MRNAAPKSTCIDLLGRMRRNPRSTGAWEEFNRDYGPLIQGWCRSRGLAEADVDDVGQDVRVRLVTALGRLIYDPARTFRGWLKTVVDNAIVDHRRRWGRAVRGSGNPKIEQSIRNLPERSRDGSADFDLELLEEAMSKVRARVAEQNWRAFVLSAIEQRTVDEIVEALGMHASKVYVARCRIQKMLSQEVSSLTGCQRG